MPARVDLDPLRHEIEASWDARIPKSQILAWIHEQGDPFTTCSLSTLKRTFRKWNMKWKGPMSYMHTFGTADSELLIALFYKAMISDNKILRNLHKQNFLITKRQLKRFRFAHDLKRKRELKDRKVQDRELQKKLATIVKNSVITSFDCRLLYIYLHVNRQEFVGRNRIEKIMKMINPQKIQRRDEQTNRRQRK